MSSLIAAPELITTAATDVASIGSTLSAAHAAAAAPTTGILAAAEDEVSVAIADLFSGHGQAYQALSAQVAAFHEQFVQALTAGAGSYASAEAANASLLQPWNAIAGWMGGVESRFGALLNALGHTPPGQFMHTLLLGTGIENPFFGVPPGQVMHTEFIPGTGIENPLFGVAASDIQGQNPMNDLFFLFFPIFKIFEDIPQELAQLILLLLLF